MKELGRYENGNYEVILLEDGTKIRHNGLPFLFPDFPESMDVKITNACDIGCPMCLKSTAKLSVRRDNSSEDLVSISNIKIGDFVLSYNIESGCKEYRQVDHLYIREYNGDMIEIEDAAGNLLMCTANHKIYTARGYVRADELTENDELIDL